jgi:hypothetical protein
MIPAIRFAPPIQDSGEQWSQPLSVSNYRLRRFDDVNIPPLQVGDRVNVRAAIPSAKDGYLAEVGYNLFLLVTVADEITGRYIGKVLTDRAGGCDQLPLGLLVPFQRSNVESVCQSFHPGDHR